MRYIIGFEQDFGKRHVRLDEVDENGKITDRVTQASHIEVDGYLTTTEQGQVVYIPRDAAEGGDTDDDKKKERNSQKGK